MASIDTEGALRALTHDKGPGPLKPEAPAFVADAALTDPRKTLDPERVARLAPKKEERAEGYKAPFLGEARTIDKYLRVTSEAFLRNATRVEKLQAEKLLGARWKTERESKAEEAANERARKQLIERFYKQADIAFKKAGTEPGKVVGMSQQERQLFINILNVRCQGESVDQTGANLSEDRRQAIGDLAALSVKMLDNYDRHVGHRTVYDLLRNWAPGLAENFRPGTTAERLDMMQKALVKAFNLQNAEEFFAAPEATQKDVFEKFLENTSK